MQIEKILFYFFKNYSNNYEKLCLVVEIIHTANQTPLSLKNHNKFRKRKMKHGKILPWNNIQDEKRDRKSKLFCLNFVINSEKLYLLL